jgi:hypothetical protein
MECAPASKPAHPQAANEQIPGIVSRLAEIASLETFPVYHGPLAALASHSAYVRAWIRHLGLQAWRHLGGSQRD